MTHKGRGSQVRVGNAIRAKLVPALSLRLKELHQSALNQRSGRHHAVIKPMLAKINDYDVIAHITLSCVLDGVGRGAAMSTPLTVCQNIGERVDHQCFLPGGEGHGSFGMGTGRSVGPSEQGEGLRAEDQERNRRHSLLRITTSSAWNQ